MRPLNHVAMSSWILIVLMGAGIVAGESVEWSRFRGPNGSTRASCTW